MTQGCASDRGFRYGFGYRRMVCFASETPMVYGYAAVKWAVWSAKPVGYRVATGTAVRFDYLESGVSARPSSAGAVAAVEVDQLPGQGGQVGCNQVRSDGW